MIDILVCLGLVMAGGLGTAILVATRAPMGYEDGSGFHYGPEIDQAPQDFHGVLARSTR